MEGTIYTPNPSEANRPKPNQVAPVAVPKVPTKAKTKPHKSAFN